MVSRTSSWITTISSRWMRLKLSVFVPGTRRTAPRRWTRSTLASTCWCEKPMAATLVDATAMTKAAHETGLISDGRCSAPLRFCTEDRESHRRCRHARRYLLCGGRGLPSLRYSGRQLYQDRLPLESARWPISASTRWMKCCI